MYKLSPTETFSGVYRVADGAWIPEDLSNCDWLAYLDWVADGNEPLPWE